MTLVSRLLPSECGRLVAGVLKDSVAEVRKDEGARMSQYVHAELSRSGGH